MREDRKGFSVRDRRHFDPDGSARTEPADPIAPEGPGVEPEPTPSDEAVDFGSFVLSLGAQGAMLLGAGGAGAAEARVDLVGARSIVAILEMLKSKTEGRRTSEEDEILDGILYDLRMAYVARTRASGK